ncbi:MAG TPA: hypothetical protein PK402_07000, partial [Tepidisphaeraceae bacterium]|nr:hypothetical protein [Tepidisphaeraceae bacterium]
MIRSGQSLWDDVDAAGTVAPTQNLNVKGTSAIVTPRRLTHEIPSSPAISRSVVEGRDTIRKILRGEDPRLLVVIGPCSVHDVDSARAYAEKLASLRDRVSDRFF